MTKPISRKMAVDCLLDRIVREFGKFLTCTQCGMGLMPGEKVQFDHIHSDALGGLHEYMNLRPIHYDPCHKRKSKKDVAALAKVDRLLGITCNKPKKKIPSRPWPKRA